jgi:prepilin-type N-terminal cleavage/methylation domain-containing protein
MRRTHSGITVVELMIVLAIIGISAAVAIPAYLDYVRKTAYSEVLSAATAYKLAVEECYLSSNGADAATKLGTCDAGTSGIPAAPTAVTRGAFKTLTVENGVITMTPNAVRGILADDTCVLTPADDSFGRLNWRYSGACLSKRYATN